MDTVYPAFTSVSPFKTFKPNSKRQIYIYLKQKMKIKGVHVHTEIDVDHVEHTVRHKHQESDRRGEEIRIRGHGGQPRTNPRLHVQELAPHFTVHSVRERNANYAV
jgi:hypothetical protein